MRKIRHSNFECGKLVSSEYVCNKSANVRLCRERIGFGTVQASSDIAALGIQAKFTGQYARRDTLDDWAGHIRGKYVVWTSEENADPVPSARDEQIARGQKRSWGYRDPCGYQTRRARIASHPQPLPVPRAGTARKADGSCLRAEITTSAPVMALFDDSAEL